MCISVCGRSMLMYATLSNAPLACSVVAGDASHNSTTTTWRKFGTCGRAWLHDTQPKSSAFQAASCNCYSYRIKCRHHAAAPVANRAAAVHTACPIRSAHMPVVHTIAAQYLVNLWGNIGTSAKLPPALRRIDQFALWRYGRRYRKQVISLPPPPLPPPLQPAS